MVIRLWDSQSNQWHIKEVIVLGKPRTGPSDKYLKVHDAFVVPDKNGDFCSKTYADEELDAVHTFVVARITIDLWEKALAQSICWAFPGPLMIRLNEPIVEAKYFEDQSTIAFGKAGKMQRFTCRSIDIVAHETTHAILTTLFSSTTLNKNLENRAFTESICDISSIIVKNKLSGNVFDSKNTDFTKANYLSEFALGYSDTKDDNFGIRSALEKLNVAARWSTPYSKSSFLTNKFYHKFIQLLLVGNESMDTSLDKLFSEIGHILLVKNKIPIIYQQLLGYFEN